MDDKNGLDAPGGLEQGSQPLQELVVGKSAARLK
jgi:hypothetical protein